MVGKRRAQGIAFSTIVTGALALLVLFIVGFIFLNWMRGASQSTPKSVDNFKRNCKMWCEDLGSQADLSDLGALTVDEVKEHLYCTKFMDTSRYGGIVMDHCWDERNYTGGLQDIADLVKVKCHLKVIIPGDPSAGISNYRFACTLDDLSVICGCPGKIYFHNKSSITGATASGYINCTTSGKKIYDGISCLVIGG